MALVCVALKVSSLNEATTYQAFETSKTFERLFKADLQDTVRS